MASDLRGYTEQETLNKVLNTDNDSIQVDIVDATGVSITTTNESVYADDADWTDSTSKHTLVGGLYQGTPQGITDGDTGPLQVNAAGNLIVDVIGGGVLETLVDGVETLLGTIDGDTSTIAGDTTSVDGKITACNTGAVVLAAGSAAIGKLAANDGVDIGDVDVASVVTGVAATNLGKAIQSQQGTTDTGVAALVVRNDALADLSGADGDYTPLQVNKTGALNVTETTGHLGAIFQDNDTNITSKQVIAIQFIEDTTFTTLTPVDSSYIGTASGNGEDIDTSNTFPQGMTIFGRWTGYRLASGTIVAYQGDW